MGLISLFFMKYIEQVTFRGMQVQDSGVRY